MKQPLPPATRILLPIDFSECTVPALRFAANVAQQQGAEIIVLHVCEYELTGSWEVDLAQAISKRAPPVEKQLIALVEAQLRPAVTARTLVLSGGAAAKILETAARTKVDLIIMGSHCRRGLEHARFGSVAEQVVRKARCPVLILPRDQWKKTNNE